MHRCGWGTLSSGLSLVRLGPYLWGQDAGIAAGLAALWQADRVPGPQQADICHKLRGLQHVRVHPADGLQAASVLGPLRKPDTAWTNSLGGAAEHSGHLRHQEQPSTAWIGAVRSGPGHGWARSQQSTSPPSSCLLAAPMDVSICGGAGICATWSCARSDAATAFAPGRAQQSGRILAARCTPCPAL